MQTGHNTRLNDARQYVVVHGGARDSYQVALALQEAGLLKALVTDVFFSQSGEKGWRRWLPTQVRSLLRARTATLPGERVIQKTFTGVLAAVLERCRWIPFSWRRLARRRSDLSLGRTAGKLARQSASELLAYSYFGTPAFQANRQAALLFQVHPHPLTVRRILQEELMLHPECADSLQQEWELALPASDLQSLVHESQVARGYVVASSFTRDSLIEHGVSPQRIWVVPYGVDFQRFHPAPRKRPDDGPLRLLFVGRMNQRKGLVYLLHALEMLTDVNIHLTVCGRVVDNLDLFRPFAARVTVRPSVSASELVKAYQEADLFVFPSVAEGFGQVLLEALACGLPVLSTTHTAAPDLIEDGVHGWIVPPRNVEMLADRIRWASQHPAALQQMSLAARARAEQYTWQRFRSGVVNFVASQPRSEDLQVQAMPAELVQV